MKIYKIIISKILNARVAQLLNVQFTRDEELVKWLEKNHKIDDLHITCEEVEVKENE